MAEYHIAATSNALLQSLDFSLPPSANYVTSRRTCYTYTSGASAFTPNGVKVARLTIAADAWLDCGTLALCFRLRNGTSHIWRPMPDASNFVERLRIFLNGTLVEDIQYYN